MLTKKIPQNINFHEYFTHFLKNVNIIGLTFPTSKQFYEESIQNIEKWNKFVHFWLVEVAPKLTFIQYGMSYIEYFTNDLDGRAFQFPTPMW